MKREGIVLFDCFGLFANDGMVDYFRRHEVSLEVKDRFCAPADRGEKSLDEVLAEMAEYFHEPVEKLRRETIGTIRVDEGMVDLLRRLMKHHYVALLSNCMKGSMEAFFGDTDFLSLFDATFLSCDLGLIKPNADYYAYCLDKLKAYPGPRVFFDDNPVNVEGAKKASVDAVRFLSQEGCEEELLRRGYRLI